MRIAYLLTDSGIPFFGQKGASVHARAITEAIRQLGHEVICYVAKTGDIPAQPHSVPVRNVKVNSFHEDLIEEIFSTMDPEERKIFMRREISGLCRNEPFRRRLEADHREQPFDLLIERYSLWSYAGLRAARDLSVPILLEVNAPLPEEQIRFRSLGLEVVARAIRKQLFREVNGIIAVSKEVADGAIKEGAEPDRVAVIPNGFDPTLFHYNGTPATERSRITIGFLGSLKPWHGIQILCQAFARVAEEDAGARLLLVGDGPLGEWVQEFAIESGLTGRIETTGRLPHTEIPSQLRRFDLAVAPYADPEGFYFSPLKLFEYMGAGLPIVASNLGQIAEVLDHGRTGWLVTPGDPDALAESILHLAGNSELRKMMARRAAQEAKLRYPWRETAKKVLQLGERVLAAREVSNVS